VGHVELSRGIGKSYKTLVGKIKNEVPQKTNFIWKDDTKIKLSEIECPCCCVDLSNLV
jgi:hypothetical protein